ncbi:TIGR03808 family TAT-translocated repetitive protein [Bosea sp. 117]|uniref:TIGR03808 family TAT-translocated repetitive protein n=1 Tax=Bosea sp. 117 TaxID=1125973 RepID=UPI00068CDD14|nr:TIGR03808 family TAT-translocated repetitive protein [Bosea sp. 117]
MAKLSDTPILSIAGKPSRRAMLGSAGVALGFAATQAVTGKAWAAPGDMTLAATSFGVKPGSGDDQSRAIQKALDAATQARLPLFFPPGSYVASELVARPGLRLLGVPGASRIVHAGGINILSASKCDGFSAEGLGFDGGKLPIRDGEGLLTIADSAAVSIRDCTVTGSYESGLVLRSVAGDVTGCTVDGVGVTGIFALDSRGLALRDNTVRGCANNGIQVWQSEAREDGTLVTGNRISDIAARDGGTGENGNGINVFRAGNVIVANNRISKCAFTAVRCNSSSNVQVLGNNCSDMGEVALFVEFGYQGAVVANNIIERAVFGINVTNFDTGGRLAVVQGNVMRDFVAPPVTDNPDDVGSIGIIAEADIAVTGNVIEGANYMGMRLGYGPFLRDLTVTGNVIRRSGIGIGVSLVEGAGQAVIADNLIAESVNGALVGFAWSKATTGDLLAPGAKVDPRLTLSGNRVR